MNIIFTEKTKDEMEAKLKEIPEGFVKERVLLRFKAVEHYSNGKTFLDIGKILDVIPNTVYDWIKKYEKGGVEALIFKNTKGMKLNIPKNIDRKNKQNQHHYPPASKRIRREIEEKCMAGVDYSKH
jgi:transposase